MLDLFNKILYGKKVWILYLFLVVQLDLVTWIYSSQTAQTVYRQSLERQSYISPRKVTVQAKSSIATISAANEVPKMLAPKISKTESRREIIKDGEEIKMTPLDETKQEKLREKLDLSGIEQCTEEQKSQV